MSIGTISVVITTHGNADDLDGMLSCLRQQREYLERTRKGIRGTLVDRWIAGPRLFDPVETVIAHDGEYPWSRAESFLVSKVIECPKQGGVGHHTRGPGIEAATGAWIVLTNSDNYFVNGWQDRVIKTILDEGGPRKVGVAYWNCINNLWAWTDHGGSKISRGSIDLSCAIVRADIAKKVGFPWRDYDGDFDYILACCDLAGELKLKVVQMNQTLCVHN